jgi:DNA primase RepB-like protein
MSDHAQAWLSVMNDRRFNIYCSVNGIGPGRRSRTREAIAAIRHVFLDADDDGPAVLVRIADRRDIPAPSYVLTSSPGRVHVFWRAAGFDTARVEALQKHLARELGTDVAATPVTQTTRLVGFENHKYERPFVVTVVYGDVDRVFTPTDFPSIPETTAAPVAAANSSRSGGSSVERALRYVARVPPAITGQHGDVHTFRVCCRLVRGFALGEEEALAVLEAWNAQCCPPWDDADLRESCVERASTDANQSAACCTIDCPWR